MQPQRLILEDTDTTYNILIESTRPIQPSSPESEFESYGNETSSGESSTPTVPPEIPVKLAEVHRTIQGYTQYAIGAFKNLAIADVEEVNLKFNIKISAEGGIPIIASGKTESDFSIEVKCKFPNQKNNNSDNS